MAAKELKQHLQTTFKLSGLQLRLEACKYLTDLLLPVSAQDREEWIEKILGHVEKQKLKTAVIDVSVVEKAVAESTHQVAGDENRDILNTISAYETPRLTFSVERKKYLADSVMGRPPPQLLTKAGMKHTVYHDRYVMLRQRTARHDLFTSSGKQEDTKEGEVGRRRYQLKPVEYLLGTTNRLDDVIVLGMLTQITYGSYYLEDPSGVVKLELGEAKFHTGLYTENCFVLAEGWYDDGVFNVLALGFPPAEPAATTQAYFGSLNFFGGPMDKTVKSSEKLVQLEAASPDAMFVFIADVWLDEPAVQARLRRLFVGYSDVPPTAFVFFGNFLNASSGSANYASSLKEHLKQLGEMITEYPELVRDSKFMFVPGPADPGSPCIFPRPPLPTHITKDFEALVPSSHFLTNPARIQYCTQHIVLFREDIVTKMCRNAIYFPENENIPTHFARTVTCQAHLAPLPLHTCPVYWDHDRSLSLYPLPDLIVTADKFEPFTAENLDCKVINPGSFVKHDFCFKTYIPSSRSVEDSQVPGGEDD